MKTCSKCGKQGLFLKLTPNGLCESCNVIAMEEKRKEAQAITKAFDDDFFMKYNVTLRDFESHIVTNYTYSQKTHIYNDKKRFLEATLASIEKLKEFCAERPGGAEYFSKIWEKPLSSAKSRGLNYIKRTADELNDLIENREKYIELERIQERIANFSKPAETDIFQIIEDEPGILQKDLYKKFNPEFKSAISEILYFAQKENKVKREKVSSTYALFLLQK